MSIVFVCDIIVINFIALDNNVNIVIVEDNDISIIFVCDIIVIIVIAWDNNVSIIIIWDNFGSLSILG